MDFVEIGGWVVLMDPSTLTTMMMMHIIPIMAMFGGLIQR